MFASIVLTVAAVGAQEAVPDAPAATLVERVTVNIVNIDVHVTDRRGRPVSDLSIDDFEVFEEGEPMEITNFLNAASRDDREWLEGGASREVHSVDPPLMVALYIDRHRTRHAHLLRIEKDLAAFLSARRDHGAGIRFLLASGDTELDIRVPFTTDPGRLMNALQELRAEPGSLAADDDMFRLRIMREIRMVYEECAQRPAERFACVPCVDTWETLLGSASHYAAEMQSRTTASISALGELVAALGGLPGPKALIYISDGLPQRPGAELFHYLGDVCPERQAEAQVKQFEWDETTRFNRFSAFSNASRVALYPVDAAGVRASSSVDASLAGPIEHADGSSSVDFRLAVPLVPSQQNDRLRTDNLQTTLHLLADETGGRAVFNQPHPAEALEEIAEDFGSYYSLGYSAPLNRRHPIRQIDVRLTSPRKGWRVRHRRTYIMKSEEQRLADRLYAALRLNEQSNPLNVDVTFGELAARTAPTLTTVPVEVRVPPSEVTLLPGPDGSAGAVRIFLMAENTDGGRTPLRQKTLTVTEAQLAAQRPEAEQKRSLAVVNVDLPPGDFAVAVGVRDEASGRASYLVREIVLP